uniref:Ovule protein n=1 Tax=Steinernema glaseri TaxID=37863 RepID=A0A1I7ZS55_9BILA
MLTTLFKLSRKRSIPPKFTASGDEWRPYWLKKAVVTSFVEFSKTVYVDDVKSVFSKARGLCSPNVALPC